MESKKIELIIFSALFVCLLAILFFVFRPFIGILILAIAMAVLFHPLHEKLVKLFHGGKSLVALLLVVAALIFLIIPVLFFGVQIFLQAQSFFSSSQVIQGQYIQSIQQTIDTLIRHIVPGFSFNLTDSINNTLAFVSNNMGGLLSQTIYVFFNIFFLLFAFFFFLRDGNKIMASLVSLSPFGKERNREVLGSASLAITSVIRGTLFVGLVRFVLFSVAFYLIGIPNALLWGSIGGIIGVIPGLGTPFVIIPAFLYLLFCGNIFLAIIMLALGILIFFFIDNLLFAYFFGRGLDVPAPFILFSILGGVVFSGPLGFIFGPIALSIFVSALDMYKILVLKNKPSINKPEIS